MVTICMRCCELVETKVISDVVSQCHRKYCWLCGYSSDSDLTFIKEEEVRKKCEKLGIQLKD